MFKRSYIDNHHGGQIHVTESGAYTTDTPSILLIHQTPRSSDEFKEVMEHVGGDYHLIAMDLPGMGNSSPTSQMPTIEDYAQAAAVVIEHYGALAMTVCGHHTGGVVAVELAAQKPDYVQSLILSSTPWVDQEIRIIRSRKAPIDQASSIRDGSHLINYWQQRSPYYPQDVSYMDRFIVDALRSSNAVEGHLAVGQYHMELAAPKVECPVLLVEHMKDPFSVKSTPHLQDNFSGAVIECISDGVVALEVTAGAFSEVLLKWMRRP